MRITPLFWHRIYWGTSAARRLFPMSLASLFALHLGPGSNGLRLDNELSLETSLKLKWVLDTKSPVYSPYPPLFTLASNQNTKQLQSHSSERYLSTDPSSADAFQVQVILHFQVAVVWRKTLNMSIRCCCGIFSNKSRPAKAKKLRRHPGIVNHISPPLNCDCNDSKGS